jgi:hypothetical protein
MFDVQGSKLLFLISIFLTFVPPTPVPSSANEIHNGLTPGSIFLYAPTPPDRLSSYAVVHRPDLLRHPPSSAGV